MSLPGLLPSLTNQPYARVCAGARRYRPMSVTSARTVAAMHETGRMDLDQDACHRLRRRRGTGCVLTKILIGKGCGDAQLDRKAPVPGGGVTLEAGGHLA